MHYRTIMLELENIYLEDVLDEYCAVPDGCMNARVRNKAREVQAERRADEHRRAESQRLAEEATAENAARPAKPPHESQGERSPTGWREDNGEGGKDRPMLFQAAVDELRRGVASVKTDGLSGVLAAASGPKYNVKNRNMPVRAGVPRRIGR
jgi:hypothetical protein